MIMMVLQVQIEPLEVEFRMLQQVTQMSGTLFGDEVLESKFQDGHYVYSVIAGGGTGSDVYPPTIYVVDIESAVDFNNVLMP